jgi:tyrosyl-tRNA synthetase
VAVNGERVETADRILTVADLEDGILVIRQGKKKFFRVLPDASH